MFKVIETQGRPHTLTQTDGKTFRLFARQEKTIEANLVSPEFYAEQTIGNIILTPIEKNEEIKKKNTVKKGGSK